MGEVNTKPFWRSTTLWINAVGILATILTIVSGMVKDAEVVALLIAIANILNRFRNVEPKKLTIK
jgi:Mg2+/citrate symporter